MTFTQIKETCLYVSDLNQTIDFYSNRIGLELFSHVKGSHAFFRAGTSVLLCFLPEVSKGKTSLPPHFAYGQQHIAFETEQGKSYDKWKEKIIKAGIDIEHEHKWPHGHRSLYFRDPDQHALEIIEQGMWEA